MCGLITIITRKATEKLVDEVMERGFGVLEVSADRFKIRRATEAVKALIDVTRTKSPIIMFHHRQPTGTDNTLEQTHPIKVSHAELQCDYYVMHNGVIHNAVTRNKVHTEELGYAYTTKEEKEETTYNGTSYASRYRDFNDSEALAIDLARFIEGLETTIKSQGAAAFIILQINKKTQKPQRIFWGTNGRNPLVMYATKDQIELASELPWGEDAAVDTLYSIKIANLNNKKKSLEKQIMKTTITFEKEPEIVRAPVTTSYPSQWSGAITPRPPTQPALPATTSEKVCGFQAPAANDVKETRATRKPPENLSARELAFWTSLQRDMRHYEKIINSYCDTMRDKMIDEMQNEMTSVYQEMAHKDLGETEQDLILEHIINFIFTDTANEVGEEFAIYDAVSSVLAERLEAAKKPREWFDAKDAIEFGESADMKDINDLPIGRNYLPHPEEMYD